MRRLSPLSRIVILPLAIGTVFATSAAPAPGAGAQDGSGLKEDLTEARLKLEVRLALLDHFKLDALHIGISVEGTEVTLTGTVKHKSTQELAKEVALSVNGVSGVDNRLAVEPGEAESDSTMKKEMGKAGQELDDAALESKVKLRLLDSIGLKAFKVEVEASEGIVSLRGTLPGEDFHRIAVRVARNTDGVKKVIDLIKVR